MSTHEVLPGSRIAGHLLVECLVAQGVDHAFGVPGESYLAVLDGFHAYREQIRFVINRQEGGAAFMAEAARQADRPARHLLRHARPRRDQRLDRRAHRVPGLDADGAVRRRRRQRLPRPRGLPGSRLPAASSAPAPRAWPSGSSASTTPSRIPEYVARAFATAMNGRPGPVVLVLPEDMLTQHDRRRGRCRAWSRCRPGATRARCARCARCCWQSKQPFVIAGGGGWTPQAAQALQRFAENWKLPVGNAFRFQDTFDNHHPLYAGDVGIGINPKLAARVKRERPDHRHRPAPGRDDHQRLHAAEAPRPKQKLVHIHASAEELNRVYQADLAINATMNAAARSLEVLTAPPEVPWAGLDRGGARRLRGQPGAAGAAGRRSTCRRIVGASLQKHLPHDAMITNGAGNFASWVHRFFQLPRPGEGPQDAARADQRRDGLRRAGRHRGQHRDRPHRRSRSPATATS